MVSENSLRVRKLLMSGLLGGHLAGLVCVGGFALGGGVEGAVSAALAAAVTIAFFTIGQAVQIWVADAPPKRVMAASLASYGLRVTLLGLALMVTLDQADRFAWLHPMGVVVTTIAVVFGWLLAEFRAYRHLRIPAFDTEYKPPAPDRDDVA